MHTHVWVVGWKVIALLNEHECIALPLHLYVYTIKTKVDLGVWKLGGPPPGRNKVFTNWILYRRRAERVCKLRGTSVRSWGVSLAGSWEQMR